MFPLHNSILLRGMHVYMKLLFGLEFVCVAQVHRVLHRSGAVLDAPWIQHKSPNPSFEIICELQKLDLLIEKSLHHHFCIFRVEHLWLQIFEIFFYCYVWLIQMYFLFISIMILSDNLFYISVTCHSFWISVLYFVPLFVWYERCFHMN